ncbi:4-hydroxy-tetrahydrodipicolinate reductase [Winogradskyella sp. 3972H.M.0a.05]|uniref:4-hydroxy-tetrahydrodipicolinate reductase n=1 Tax=Winogradskyella sp. 3972H.M.0a.05 TaxID=2950277 RepID=UPI0033996E15
MNIALLGYGKMGQTIEQIALQRGHTITLKTTSKTEDYSFENVDVAIDFSIPESAFKNINKSIKSGIPTISGTTGWLNKYNDIVELCKSENGAFLYASNFSLGVNLFFELNTYLSKLMKDFQQYDIALEEIHHTQKLDAPSGTAISLANDIIKETDHKNWTLNTPKSDEIGITAKRIEDVPGTHIIEYTSEIDSIEIKHTAHNRLGFALGAVIAAEWIVDKKGVFSMKDVLNINS